MIKVQVFSWFLYTIFYSWVFTNWTWNFLRKGNSFMALAITLVSLFSPSTLKYDSLSSVVLNKSLSIPPLQAKNARFCCRSIFCPLSRPVLTAACWVPPFIFAFFCPFLGKMLEMIWLAFGRLLRDTIQTLCIMYVVFINVCIVICRKNAGAHMHRDRICLIPYLLTTLVKLLRCLCNKQTFLNQWSFLSI